MTAAHPLAGIYAAALTPLHTDLTLAPEAVISFLNHLAARGAHGALLFGTTGEGPSFSAPERRETLRAALAVRQTHPSFRLLAGTGSPSLDESISLTRAAFDFGYDGVVVLPPYYFRKVSDDGLLRWYDSLIRQAVPEGGYLLGYHIPHTSGVPLSLDLLARLKDAHPQKFAGIKDSSSDPAHAVALGGRFGKDLLVFSGNDGLMLHALEHHAGGAITALANIYADLLRQVWNIYQQDGDALEAQAALSQRRKVLDRYSPFPPILKGLAARKFGFPHWPVKPPLLDCSSEILEQAWQEFSALDRK
ncbi:MAG: dihydrodipicolinate synthase family protein [Anaerolineales bacterium]|jgi:4-hydroxy-tetrahydrodipicolinate synthase|nr:dihydrodipicolinate synthase family protein [Anaerolineales bacterium]